MFDLLPTPHLSPCPGPALPPGIRACRVSVPFAGGQLPPGAQRCWEVFFCQSGRMRLGPVGGRPLTLNARQVLILSPQAAFSGAGFGPLAGLALFLHPARAEGPLQALSQALGGLPVSLPAALRQLAPAGGWGRAGSSPWSEAAFAALEELPEPDAPGYALLKTAELLYLTATGCPVLSSPSTGRYHDRYQREVVEKVCQYIQSHVGEDLRIQALAQRFRVSPTALKRSFRQLQGKTLHDAVLDRRMETAAQLLATTDLPVIQIAGEVGYNSVSQFSAMFRRRLALSPAQFRKRNKKSLIPLVSVRFGTIFPAFML